MLMKNLLFSYISLFFVSLFILSCQKDDTIRPQSEVDFSQNNLQQKFVNADDIPEVMDFLKRSGPYNLKYTIQTGSLIGENIRSGEPDLVLSDLVTSQILAITNEANLTNYSFQLQIENAPVYEGEVSFFNLIVKETTAQVGYYAYIQEYRMDENWYRNQGLGFDLTTYTGKMIFYNLEGIYVAKLSYSNGQITEEDLRSPCSGGGSGSGGGGSGNNNPDPGGGTGGRTGGGSGGSGIQVVVVVCTGGPEHQPGDPECECYTDPNCEPGYIIIMWGSESGGDQISELIRTPCCDGQPCEDPIVCVDQFNEPCDCNATNDGCIEENPNVGINHTKPHPDCAILNQIAEHQQTISKIVQLQTQLNNQYESGFNLFKSSQGNVNSTNIDSGNYVTFPFSSNPVVFGGVHLHHNKGFPMFSLQDVLTLDQFYNNFANNGNPPEKVNPTLIMVSSLGVYAIKIENLQAY